MKRDFARVYAVGYPALPYRARHFEIEAAWITELTTAAVIHHGPSLALRYAFLGKLSSGLHAAAYPFASETTTARDLTRAQLSPPRRSDRAWEASGVLAYVPIVGKLLVGESTIVYADVGFALGLGVLDQRPASVVDPTVRKFAYAPTVAGHGSLAMRLFFVENVALRVGLRLQVFDERRESMTIAAGAAREDARTWLGASGAATHADGEIGLSFVIPIPRRE